MLIHLCGNPFEGIPLHLISLHCVAQAAADPFVPLCHCAGCASCDGGPLLALLSMYVLCMYVCTMYVLCMYVCTYVCMYYVLCMCPSFYVPLLLSIPLASMCPSVCLSVSLSVCVAGSPRMFNRRLARLQATRGGLQLWCNACVSGPKLIKVS